MVEQEKNNYPKTIWFWWNHYKPSLMCCFAIFTRVAESWIYMTELFLHNRRYILEVLVNFTTNSVFVSQTNFWVSINFTHLICIKTLCHFWLLQKSRFIDELYKRKLLSIGMSGSSCIDPAWNFCRDFLIAVCSKDVFSVALSLKKLWNMVVHMNGIQSVGTFTFSCVVGTEPYHFSLRGHHGVQERKPQIL